MAKTSISNLDSQSTTLFADNTANGIEEVDLRTHFDDIVDSFVHLDESKYQRQAGTAGGSANALTVSIDYPAAYTADIPIRFKAASNNTSTPTFKVNSLAALNIYDINQNQVTAANSLEANSIYVVEWSTDADGGGTDGFILTNSGGSVAASGAFDAITNQAGTGRPSFTNGLVVPDGKIVRYGDHIATYNEYNADVASGGNFTVDLTSVFDFWTWGNTEGAAIDWELFIQSSGNTGSHHWARAYRPSTASPSWTLETTNALAPVTNYLSSIAISTADVMTFTLVVSSKCNCTLFIKAFHQSEAST